MQLTHLRKKSFYISYKLLIQYKAIANNKDK